MNHSVVAERLPALTKREREVFDLLLCGYTQGGAAAFLGIGHKTLDTHLEHIAGKFGLEGVKQMPWKLLGMVLEASPR